MLEYVRGIADELKSLSLSNEEQQSFLLAVSNIMNYLKKQLERPGETIPPFVLSEDKLYVSKELPSSVVIAKLTDLRVTVKVVLVWIYQKLKALSMTLAMTSVQPSIVAIGVQVRNMRNALRFIRGKKAKAQTAGRTRLALDRTLTLRIMQASKIS